MHEETIHYTYVESPLGRILLACSEAGLVCISLQNGDPHVEPDPDWQRDDVAGGQPALREAAGQLTAYFAGDLYGFDLPLAPDGTAFQRQVWRGLCAIPYGETISYGELAERIGRPGAARAVGAANGRNPLPIVVPCHRVVGADGSLTGYGGGLHIKKALLELEARSLQPALLG